MFQNILVKFLKYQYVLNASLDLTWSIYKIRELNYKYMC